MANASMQTPIDFHNKQYREQLADALEELTSKDAINNSLLHHAAKALRVPLTQPVCETCNGDPAVCATVPGLRHCEAANRKYLEPVNVRRMLEESNLPVEIAAAIADVYEGLMRPEAASIPNVRESIITEVQGGWIKVPAMLFRDGERVEVMVTPVRSRPQPERAK